MKNLMFFLFGLGIGAGGTFLYLHKTIRKELDDIRKDSQVPFTVNEENKEKENNNGSNSAVQDTRPNAETSREAAARQEAKIAYHKIVEQTANNDEYASDPGVVILPREESTMQKPFWHEIDCDEFMRDNEGFEKERITWWSGDHIMTTEDDTPIQNPAMLVGNEWRDYIGHSRPNTAFVRNERLRVDYEIYVDEGFFNVNGESSNEFGGN